MEGISLSKYKDIADDIESKIAAQIYTDRLPDQTELARIYCTSRVTIVRALKVLIDKNLVKTIKGHGTYINSQTSPDVFLDFDINEKRGLTSIIEDELDIINDIFTFKVRMPSSSEAHSLDIDAFEQVYDIARVRCINRQAVKIEYSVFPFKLLPNLTEETLKHSVYQYAENQQHLKIGDIHQIITAEKANSYDIKYLHCQKNDPILTIHRQVLLNDGRPFEISESRIRYDRGSLSISNNQVDNKFLLD